MTKIKWTRNEFQKFYAVLKIKVGGVTPIDIEKGDEFEYDGTILKYAGHEVSQPSLRGIFDAGWATAIEGEDFAAPARQVSRNMALAQSRNENLSHVMRGQATTIESSEMDEERVADVSSRRGTGDRDVPQVITSSKQMVTKSQIQSSGDEGLPIARIRTPARSGPVNMTDQRNYSLAKDLEDRTAVKPEYLIEIPNAPARQVLKAQVTEQRTDVAESGPVVGGVQQLDERSQPQVGGRSTPKRVVKLDSALPPRVRVARAIHDEFPSDWSFDGKLLDRVKNINNHLQTVLLDEDRHDEFLQALYAAEGDQMRKKMSELWPDLF